MTSGMQRVTPHPNVNSKSRVCCVVSDPRLCFVYSEFMSDQTASPSLIECLTGALFQITVDEVTGAGGKSHVQLQHSVMSPAFSSFCDKIAQSALLSPEGSSSLPLEQAGSSHVLPLSPCLDTSPLPSESSAWLQHRLEADDVRTGTAAVLVEGGKKQQTTARVAASRLAPQRSLEVALIGPGSISVVGDDAAPRQAAHASAMMLADADDVALVSPSVHAVDSRTDVTSAPASKSPTQSFPEPLSAIDPCPSAVVDAKNLLHPAATEIKTTPKTAAAESLVLPLAAVQKLQLDKVRQETQVNGRELMCFVMIDVSTNDAFIR